MADHSDLHDVLPEESWLAVRATINRMLMNAAPIGVILGMDLTDRMIQTVILAIAAKHRALDRCYHDAEGDLKKAVKIITHLIEDGVYDDDGDYCLIKDEKAAKKDPAADYLDHPAMQRAREFIQYMMSGRSQ